MKKRISYIPAILVAILLTGVFQSCDKKPTKPDPEPEEHLFYVKAAYDSDSSIVKTFSVEQLKFIDSFIIKNFSVADMIVIGNNDRLLVAEGYRIRVYDLDTKEIVYTADGYGYPLQISHNSEYFLAYSDRLQVRRTDDYQLIYTDDAITGTGDFSFDSKYYIYSRDLGEVVVYNLEGDSIETTFNLSRNGQPFNIEKIWPTHDMSKLLLVGMQRSFDLAITDFGGDSVRTLESSLNRGGNDAVVSSDAEYIYFVNSALMDSEKPCPWVNVYDVYAEELLLSISTVDYNNYEPRGVALTSDGKYLMTLPRVWGPYGLLLIDTEDFSIIGRYEFGEKQYSGDICTKR